ncbi:hypothetical protein G6F60_013886 [Rhizopus arrhizus]|nr:hypothetical protein G6F60_013886 [Rhizopus arrhizus]
MPQHSRSAPLPSAEPGGRPSWGAQRFLWSRALLGSTKKGPPPTRSASRALPPRVVTACAILPVPPQPGWSRQVLRGRADEELWRWFSVTTSGTAGGCRPWRWRPSRSSWCHG